mmetsp:Transcript_4441/g.12356  ORF Transcript_4441/g.12356 Transcript_4441/m.12356 type:complete len:99 (+) Transcript_4441:16-312(+)
MKFSGPSKDLWWLSAGRFLTEIPRTRQTWTALNQPLAWLNLMHHFLKGSFGQWSSKCFHGYSAAAAAAAATTNIITTPTAAGSCGGGSINHLVAPHKG